MGLSESPGGELPEIVADKRALHQILLNLLSNAIRFTDRGGKVTIGARAEAGNIVFVVEDNGVGISDEDLARVGEPYFQARASYDRRHGGTGLGLSIVKGLVRLHGGEVTIQSRIGEGTRVSVRLPLDCERGRLAKQDFAQVATNMTRYLPPAPNNDDGAVACGGARSAGSYQHSGEEKCVSAATTTRELGLVECGVLGAVVSIILWLLAKAARRPVDSLAIVGAVVASLVIVVNALYLQSRAHPAPFVANPTRRLGQSKAAPLPRSW